MTRIAIAAVAAAFASLTALSAAAEGSTPYQNLMTPLVEGNQTILGQPILAYPDGTPQFTAAIVTVPPSGDTGWHIHEVPLFVYILEGEVTVDYGEGVVKVYQAGDSLMEAMNRPHNGTNVSGAPVRILAVYMGAEGVPNAEAAPAPQ